MNITHEPLPFAQGSYKKVFNTMPANSTSSVVFVNSDIDIEKIITKTSVYYENQPIAIKKSALNTALSELELQMLFYSVELAPRIYAIQFNSIVIIDKKPVSTKYTYYLDENTTINTVHTQIMSQLSFSGDYLQMIVLTASCEKEDFLVLIGTDKPIKNIEKALELVHTFIQKIVYHNYWFMDFKPSNFCIMQNPTRIIGLDFDRNFIININQLQRTDETLKRVAFTYMFVLAVLNLQYDMSPTEKAELQRLVRTRHLKATHISELIRTLVEFEKTGHNLCKTKYNPLSMLAYYVLPVVNINSADVLSCNMLAKPVSTFSKGFSKTTPTYDFVKTVIAENVFGLSEYNNEKSGTNYLTNPFVSNDFELYMSHIKPLQIQPLIQVLLKTTEIPMFVQEQAQLPPSKKYRASVEGGAKPRNKQRSRQRSRYKIKKLIRRFTYKKYNSIL